VESIHLRVISYYGYMTELRWVHHRPDVSRMSARRWRQEGYREGYILHWLWSTIKSILTWLHGLKRNGDYQITAILFHYMDMTLSQSEHILELWRYDIPSCLNEMCLSLLGNLPLFKILRTGALFSPIPTPFYIVCTWSTYYCKLTTISLLAGVYGNYALPGRLVVTVHHR